MKQNIIQRIVLVVLVLQLIPLFIIIYKKANDKVVVSVATPNLIPNGCTVDITELEIPTDGIGIDINEISFEPKPKNFNF